MVAPTSDCASSRKYFRSVGRLIRSYSISEATIRERLLYEAVTRESKLSETDPSCWCNAFQRLLSEGIGIAYLPLRSFYGATSAKASTGKTALIDEIQFRWRQESRTHRARRAIRRICKSPPINPTRFACPTIDTKSSNGVFCTSRRENATLGEARRTFGPI